MDSPNDRINKDFDKKTSITYGNIAEIAEFEITKRSRGQSSHDDSPGKSGMHESNG
jgi:hypothetical protein